MWLFHPIYVFHPYYLCFKVLDYYELHPIHEKVFNDFVIGKWKWIVYVLKAFLFMIGNFVYVMKAFTH